MEVARSSYIPGDPRLVDNIVSELKSQGIFDNFRKECISDVDTKPAYQNLRQRVEGSVMGFLNTQKWSPNMNKNQVREMLRKTISESGFLETGVERIVDQVVNPKINTIFFPQVENIVYKFLGIEKPAESYYKKPSVVSVNMTADINDLLPHDLEAVSPEYEAIEKTCNVSSSNEVTKLEDLKIEEDESPPFEALEESSTFPPQEESSIESHLSGISDLTSHDSNPSVGTTQVIEMDISNDNSKINSDTVLSVSVSEPLGDKIDATEDSSCSRLVVDASNLDMKVSFDNLLEQASTTDPMVVKDDEIIPDTLFTKDQLTTDANVLTTSDSLEATGTTRSDANDAVFTVPSNVDSNNVESVDASQDNTKSSKSDSKHHNSDKQNGDRHKSREHKSDRSKEYKRDHKSEKDKSHKTDKHKDHKNENDKDQKNEKEKRSDKSDGKHRSSHSSKSRNDDQDSKSSHSSSRKDDRSDKERKNKDYHHSKSRHSSSHSKDRSSKNTVSESSEQKNDSKSEKTRSKSPYKKESNHTDSANLNNKESTFKNSSTKSDLENSSAKDIKEKSDSKRHSSSSKHSKSKDSHNSSHSKSKSESRSHHSSKDRDRSKSTSKHSEKPENELKKSKYDDKHHSKSEKDSSSKKDKRDKDRKESKKDDHYTVKEKRSHRRSTDRDSSDGRSGTQSSSSSYMESITSQKCNDDSSKINSGSNSGDSGSSDQTENNSNIIVQSVVNEFQPIKLIKPKFASNIHEARRLVKIRKKINKIERQGEMILLNNTTRLNNCVIVNNIAKESLIENAVADSATPHKRRNINKEVSQDMVTNNSINKSAEKIQESVAKEVCINDKSPSPLPSAVVTKESWDAIEAKLNMSHPLNVNYNTYLDISNENDLISTCESDSTADITVSSSSEVLKLSETNEDQPSSSFESGDSLVTPSNYQEEVEVPIDTLESDDLNKNCLYLVPDDLPERQRYFESMAHRIALLEEEIVRRTELLKLSAERRIRDSQVDVSKNLPKVDIVDVTNDTEIVISPSKVAKNKVKHPDIHHNNNKRRLQFDDSDEKDENTNTQTTTMDVLENCSVLIKGKKLKVTQNSDPTENFNLPLSPADSETSVSSNSEKQKPSKTRARRNNSRQQSYTNADLYKPRLRFTSSRRRVADSPSVSKN